MKTWAFAAKHLLVLNFPFKKVLCQTLIKIFFKTLKNYSSNRPSVLYSIEHIYPIGYAKIL